MANRLLPFLTFVKKIHNSKWRNRDRGFLEQRGKIDQGPDIIPDALKNADVEGGLLDTIKPINIDNLPSSEVVNNLSDID